MEGMKRARKDNLELHLSSLPGRLSSEGAKRRRNGEFFKISFQPGFHCYTEIFLIFLWWTCDDTSPPHPGNVPNLLQVSSQAFAILIHLLPKVDNFSFYSIEEIEAPGHGLPHGSIFTSKNPLHSLPSLLPLFEPLRKRLLAKPSPSTSLNHRISELKETLEATKYDQCWLLGFQSTKCVHEAFVRSISL